MSCAMWYLDGWRYFVELIFCETELVVDRARRTEISCWVCGGMEILSRIDMKRYGRPSEKSI